MPRRTGKIARLPKDIRTQVNRMLDDGLQYGSIINWLNNEGHPDINDDNLSSWYAGGYQDWCREQDRRDQVQLQREWTQEFLHYQEPNQISQAATTLIATQLADALERFDREKLAALMADRPETYFKVVGQFLQLEENRLKTQKLVRSRQDLLTPNRTYPNLIEMNRTKIIPQKHGVVHGVAPRPYAFLRHLTQKNLKTRLLCPPNEKAKSPGCLKLSGIS